MAKAPSQTRAQGSKVSAGKVALYGVGAIGLGAGLWWILSQLKKKVEVGQRVGLHLKWTNNSEYDLEPDFRYDLHPNFALPRSWVEGPWTPGGQAAPDQEAEADVWWKEPIPGDWSGVNINAKLMVRLWDQVYEIWQKNDWLSVK
jgi:hypothetical protein